MKLTPHERKILALLLAGKSNPEIEQAVGFKPSYLRNSISKIYDKLNISHPREMLPRYTELCALVQYLMTM